MRNDEGARQGAPATSKNQSLRRVAAPPACVLRRRLDAIALDVGRLRRGVGADPTTSYQALLVDRVAWGIRVLDALTQPTAADLTRCLSFAGLGDDAAVGRALELVDERDAELHRLLGERRP